MKAGLYRFERVASAPSTSLLSVRDLRVAFPSDRGWQEVVKGVDFDLNPGSVRAVVGESGSGKSVSALALTRLLPASHQCRWSGQIQFNGRAIERLSRRELRQIRGREIAYIFQEPSASLNPVLRIGTQLEEVLRLHRKEVSNRRKAVLDALERVGMRDPERCHAAYPSELSGGMLQRVMIAMALLARPRLLIADEPTTALDATIERQIIDLLADLRRETGMAILLITHNFGIVKGFADSIQVMRNGEIVEQGSTSEVLASPRHPYTRALIQCIPRIGEKRPRLPTVATLLEASG